MATTNYFINYFAINVCCCWKKLNRNKLIRLAMFWAFECSIPHSLFPVKPKDCHLASQISLPPSLSSLHLPFPAYRTAFLWGSSLWGVSQSGDGSGVQSHCQWQTHHSLWREGINTHHPNKYTPPTQARYGRLMPWCWVSWLHLELYQASQSTFGSWNVYVHMSFCLCVIVLIQRLCSDTHIHSTA